MKSFTSGGEPVFLIDTNIIVYAHDVSDKTRHEACRKLVKSVFTGEEAACVTNQILAELFFVLTRKVGKPLSEEDAKSIVDGIIASDNWTKLDYTHKTVSRAMATSIAFKTSFWDALVAETMLENSVFEILTEDTKDFSKIPKLRVKNPIR